MKMRDIARDRVPPGRWRFGRAGNLTLSERRRGPWRSLFGVPFRVQFAFGDVIKGQYAPEWQGFEPDCAERLPVPVRPSLAVARASALSFPSLSSSVPVGALVGWML